MRAVERLVLLILVGVVGFLVGRGDRPLLADATANGNGRMVAVTGPYQNGVSLLYVVDTVSRQLAVYEARGGSRSSGRIVLVAARRIDLDLTLEGYHDDSEYSYFDLASTFRKHGLNDAIQTPPDGVNAGAAHETRPGIPTKPGPKTEPNKDK